MKTAVRSNSLQVFGFVAAATLLCGPLSSAVPDVSASAQDGNTVTIEALFCPFATSDQQATPQQEDCAYPGAGAEFTLTQVLADGERKDTATAGSDGLAIFTLDPGSMSMTVSGPAYAYSNDQPSILVNCGGTDPQGATPVTGRGFKINEPVQYGAITCAWFLQETAGPQTAWEGGFTDLVVGEYPEGVVVVYGANSDYPEVSKTVEIPYWNETGMMVSLTGIDDELDAQVDIEVLVNGNVVYSGPSSFPNHFAGLTELGVMTFQVPPEYLETTSVVTVRNLEPDANFGVPPWLQVRDLTVESDGQA